MLVGDAPVHACFSEPFGCNDSLRLGTGCFVVWICKEGRQRLFAAFRSILVAAAGPGV